ncbi:MAG: GGDEF domain-containing protein [Eubacterium sp.]|nr:GGDEF domain-containing protein [Candidatus Colimonas fimequi]
MRKIDKLKTVQLIVFILLTAVCALVVFSNKTLFHTIALDGNVRLMCIFLWASLALSFLFIFLDLSMYSSIKREYRELDYAVHTDATSGIANRYSSDVIIEKYLDKPLPAHVGAVMIELSNIKEINDQYGHIQGNNAIRVFGTILKMTSVDLCFVARNGGNRFLAIFEEGSEEKINEFISRFETKVNEGNSIPGKMKLEYRYGVAFNEGDSVKSITELISLSFNRMINS